MNKITISGRIVKEPILTTLNSTSEDNKRLYLAKFIMKVPRTYKGRIIYNFFPCIAYDNHAKLIEKAWNKNHKDVVLNGVLLSKKNQDVLEDKKATENTMGSNNKNKEIKKEEPNNGNSKNNEIYTPLLILAKSIEIFVSHSSNIQASKQIKNNEPSAEKIKKVEEPEYIDEEVEEKEDKELIELAKKRKEEDSGVRYTIEQVMEEIGVTEDDLIEKELNSNKETNENIEYKKELKESKITSAKLSHDTSNGFLNRLKKKKSVLKNNEKDNKEIKNKESKNEMAKKVTDKKDKKDKKNIEEIKEAKKENNKNQLYDENPRNPTENKINHFEKSEEDYIEELESLIMMYDDDIYSEYHRENASMQN